MNYHNGKELGVVMGGIFLVFTIGILGAVAFAPRESFEAWATFMNTMVRPTVCIVTGN